MKQLNVPQSGSQADTVASRSRFGQYLRTRRQPTQPRTSRQMEVRALLAEASQAWRGLTDAERDAWNAYALTVPRVDSLGQTIFPTGHQIFVGLYSLENDSEIVSGAPTVPTEAPPAAVLVSASTLTDAPVATITIDADLDVDLVLALYSSPPVSAGVSFNRDFRLLAYYTADVAGVVNIAAALAAKWGALVEGQKFFFRLVLITPTGGASNPTEYSKIVAGA